MPRKKKRGNNWSTKKNRTTTYNDRGPKKEKKKMKHQKYYQNNKVSQIKLSPTFKENPSAFAIGLQQKIYSLYKHSQNQQRIVYTKNKEISRLEKRIQSDTKLISNLSNDLSQYILNENISDEECKNDTDFIMPTAAPPTNVKSSKNMLTFSTPHSVEYIGNISNLDPKFVTAYKAFVKLRLYLRVLKNCKILPELLDTLNTANKLLNGVTKTLDLGSCSSSTLSRLQQFRGLDLITIETCVVWTLFWDPVDSVLTIFHDGTSQGESQESLLTAINIEEFGEFEKLIDKEFTPETRENCIIRGIWHQNIPKTDAETTVQWAAIPAFNRLDRIGYGFYGDLWLPMEERLRNKIGTMTDGNSTAQLTSSKIAAIYNTKTVMKNICLQHNYGNNMTPGVQRLKVVRLHYLQYDKKEQDIVKRTANMTILEICLNIQKVLVKDTDNIRAKGGLFKFLLGESKSVAFGREIGDRKQHQFKAVEAAVSVRHILQRLSMMADQKQKPVLYNARVLYEFSMSTILLREAICMINLGRVYSTPALLQTSKYDPMMKDCLPVIKEMLDNFSALFRVGYKSVKMLGLMLGLLSLSKVIPANVIVNKIEIQSNLEMLCDFGGIINDMSKDGLVNIG
eukprot:331696_1